MRILLIVLWAVAAAAQTDKPFLESELLFPLEHWHNHASCVVELPNGDLFACWYHGSGERQADDVIVEAARLPKGKKTWNPRYTLADTPGFPDTNPAMFVDSRQQLWLLWQVILANQWETALPKYRIAANSKVDPPQWDVSENILFIPRNFEARVKAAIEPMKQARSSAYLEKLLKNAGDKYFSRMGWMTRAHPTELPGGRIIVPLYSDGYSFSIMAYTDDGGRTWNSSEPLPGMGNIQPSIVRKRDGTLVAYMRDNGPPPKRIHISTSADDGVTWSAVRDTDIPNPGAGMEAIALREGTWVMIYNDLEKGRHSLAVSLSDDEGATWKWTRHLELDRRGAGAGSFHYPSIIQAKDGTLHATYSYFLNHLPPDAARKSIKHAHFNVAWVKQGD